MSLFHAKQAAILLSDQGGEWISSSSMFKIFASIFCAILPPGIVNTVTGGRLLAQAFPDLNGLERFGLAGFGMAAAWFFLKLALASHAKAISDKDTELARLQRVAEEKDKRIRELEDRILGK